MLLHDISYLYILKCFALYCAAKKGRFYMVKGQVSQTKRATFATQKGNSYHEQAD